MKRIGIVTSGGDAPGMNAAVRAAVRKAASIGMEVTGFERGYAGLLKNQFKPLDARSVGGIINRGGTFLKTSRAEEMKTEDGIKKAADVLESWAIEGLVVIGGEGSFRAACKLYDACGISMIGIPASIDNDLAGTDTTIGFDTAVNTALQAVDKIRDTATSHERVFVVEVMGRSRGFIALEVGLSSGAEIILIPEIKYDMADVYKKLKEGQIKGKKSGIVVMAEGVGDCNKIGYSIVKNTGFEVRITRLGHIQRGGDPTAFSRLLASKMGVASIEFLLNKEKKTMTSIQRGRIAPVDLSYACTESKPIDRELYDMAMMLST